MNINAPNVTNSVAAKALRRSGVACLGDIPWGSHICQLYNNGADLLEVLVPYFKEGLLSNEYCIWITSQALPKAQAVAALRAEIPWLDDCLAEGQIDILDYRDWYIRDGAFDGERVSQGWTEKLDAALDRGYDGMRLSGDTFWLGDEDWEPFVRYEARLDPVIIEQPILAICTYALGRLGTKEAFDAIANHELTVVRERGHWSSFKSFARHRTERASRDNEMRLRATIDGASDGIVTFDASGAILLANAAAQQMFGYESCDMLGQQIGALVPQLSHEAGEEDFLARLQEAIGSSHNADGRQRDDTLFPIEWTLRAVNAGEQDLYVGFIRDLTQQREAEVRIQKLHADRINAIGGMATALTHELNQPLAAATTYLHTAQQLLRMPAEARPASLEQTLKSASEQAVRAAKILKHIREFVVQDEPDKSVCGLHQLIDDACSLTHGSAQQASVEMSYSFRAVDDSVIADRVQIVQVIVNLIRNAVDAMRDRPERKLAIMTSSDSESVRVEVRDTGRGFSGADKARLFQPFASPRANSMGVGLSVSKSIIEAHYGQISMVSHEHGGATVSFVLPLANSRMAEEEAAE
ncbi:MAG: hypothetical protein CTY15_05975 [Methylocystis sp.]|nr:MAG: hypothetical protein CTY15_05975 [Methylocystis sp.]